MALTLRHWTAAITAACAVIGVAYLPPKGLPGSIPMPRPWERRAEVRMQHVLEREVERLRMLALRDSLVAILDTTPNRTRMRPLILVDDRLRPDIRAAVAQRTANEWYAGTQTSRISTAIAVIIDTSRTFNALPRAGPAGARPFGSVIYLLPKATNGRYCLAVVVVGHRAAVGYRSPHSDRRIVAGVGSNGIMGPCSFYHAFGTPGPSIAEWLTTTAFEFALQGDLIKDSPSAARIWPFRLIRAAPLVYIDYAPAALACLRGDMVECRSAVLHSPEYRGTRSRSNRDAYLETGILVPLRSSFWRWNELRFAGYESGYLSDLARQSGMDAFGRFWRSPLPVDSAFGMEIGTPIGDWTLRWTQSISDRPYSPNRVSPWAGLLTLAVAGLFVGGGALFAMRRKIR